MRISAVGRFWTSAYPASLGGYAAILLSGQIGLEIAARQNGKRFVLNSKTIELDRRAHRRIACAGLPEPAIIRIPNRPAISLVDVSSGGALLELPFQLQPHARFTLELITGGERLAVPFQLLRCYVAELKGGVRYHAAGFFEEAIKLPASIAGGLALSASDRLVATLEAFLRTSQATDPGARDARFNELLTWVVGALQRGEPPNLISRQIKTHLARLFPSLAIRANRVVTAPDRRFLRASAQLISLIEGNADQEIETAQNAS